MPHALLPSSFFLPSLHTSSYAYFLLPSLFGWKRPTMSTLSLHHEPQPDRFYSHTRPSPTTTSTTTAAGTSRCGATAAPPSSATRCMAATRAASTATATAMRATRATAYPRSTTTRSTPTRGQASASDPRRTCAPRATCSAPATARLAPDLVQGVFRAHHSNAGMIAT